MSTDTKERFKMRMDALAAAYNREFDRVGLLTFWNVLGALESEQLDVAFAKALAAERFCPSPATIHAYAPQWNPVKVDVYVDGQKVVTPWTQEQQQEAK